MRVSVVILVAVQTMIAVCLLSREEQQQLSGNDTVEASWSVDQHIILFATPTATRASYVDNDPRQEPAYSQGETLDATQATLRKKNERWQSGRSEVERDVGQETPDLWGGRERPQQMVHRVKDSHNEPLEEDYLKTNENMEKYKQENEGGWFKAKPDVGRGFQDEFVTYSTDSTSTLLNTLERSETVHISADNSNRGTAEHNSNGDKEIYKDDNSVHKTINNNVTNILTIRTGKIITGIDNKSNGRRSSKRASGISDSKFKTNTSIHTKFPLIDDKRNYFQDIGNNITCFTSGTDIRRSQQSQDKRCHCLEGYFGVDCGIPEAAWFDTYRNKFPDTGLSRRQVPRRVINGVPVNHEFAMFEARMHELYDVVDVFIVAESNYTAHGDPKDFKFLKRFREGYLKDFQDKIVYIPLGFFSSLSKKNGWIADAYIRYYLGERGLLLLHGLRDDDLFVLSDADELPTKEILTFLKLYDGYPEPISFALRWSVFGFFWLNPAEASWLDWAQGAKEQLTVVTSVATVGMLRELLDDNVFYIRKKNLWQHHLLAKKLRKYRSEGHLVKDWVAGTVGHYAGWHCSWCFSPENMVYKMDSAQAADLPRWGDFPQKKNLTYITSRIWQGIWFDDELRYIPVKNSLDRFYAPRYMLDHPEEYRSILFHPGHDLNLNKTWQPP